MIDDFILEHRAHNMVKVVYLLRLLLFLRVNMFPQGLYLLPGVVLIRRQG